MIFEKGYIYHIFNQGNNRQKIFFMRENYLFFLRKIKTHVTPFADILAWCLMPNHFHLMVYVREVELPYNSLGVSQRHAETNVSHAETNVSQKHTETNMSHTKIRTFNASIGIMLMGYTKALNKQLNRTGKLFREATKAECVNCPNGIAPSFVTKNGITEIKTSIPEKQYPKICFNYIHQNPVKAKLVKHSSDWNYSSDRDYAGLRNGKLINIDLAKYYELV